MRLVQIAIPSDLREPVYTVLEEREIDYSVSSETGGETYAEVVSFLLPVNAVEGVLDDLRTVGVTERAQTVVIDVETVISEEFDELEEHLDEEVTDDQIARQELQTRAEDLTPTMPVYVIMTIISAIVATAGLLLDSPAVVVGSMVIAPLIGPALSASVGTVVNDPEMFQGGFRNQVYGVLLTVLSAALFAWIARHAGMVPPGTDVFVIPEIAERIRPDLLSLFIALGAGIAGAISLTRGISTALVGVMIAAALIPPAATAGIAMAWMAPNQVLGAGVLTLVNVVSINLMGLVTLWYSGYRPERFLETSSAKRQLIKQVALYAIAVLILSSFLLGTTVTTVHHASFEQSVDEAVTETLSSAEYEDVERMDLSVQFGDSLVFADPEQVVVTFGYHGENPPDGVADAVHAGIEERTDRSVPVQIRFFKIDERQGASSSSNGNLGS